MYSEPLCRRHYASWFSEAVVLRVGLFLTAVAVSLVVAYATGMCSAAACFSGQLPLSSCCAKLLARCVYHSLLSHSFSFVLTGGFWPKVKATFDQADVQYTGDALLLFEVCHAWTSHLRSFTCCCACLIPAHCLTGLLELPCRVLFQDRNASGAHQVHEV